MLGHRTLNAEDYLAILKRRWWVICIPTLLMPFVGVAVTYFVTPRYDSTSLILIDQQKVSSDVVKPLDADDMRSSLGWITAQIKSRSTLEPIITKYNLYANQHLPMEDRVNLLRDKNLQIVPIPSQVDRANGLPGFKLILTADDPRTAQEVCADISGLYTQNDLQNRQNRTAGTNEFLQTELNEERRKLEDIEHKKAEFESKNMGALPSDQNNTANFLSQLGPRLDALTQQITSLQQNKSLMEVSLSQMTSTSVPAVVAAKTEQADETELAAAQARLATLQAQFYDGYPEVKIAKQRVADLQAKIARASAAPTAPVASPAAHVDSPEVTKLRTEIRLIDEEIAQKTKDQAQLQVQMHSFEGRLQSSPIVEEQYTQLTRDYQTELTTYNTLLAQMGKSQMSTELENRQEGASFTVFDPASLPIDPTFPKQSIFALGGMAGGLGLGLLIVALLEYRNTALRTERDVWAFTQLPTLAVIAYSDTVTHAQPTSFLKRVFRRKGPDEQLAG